MKRITPSAMLALVFFVFYVLDIQALDEQQAEQVRSWLSVDQDQRPRLDTLSLPRGMTQDQTRASISAIWKIYRDSVQDDELGPLPPTMQELAKKAENGRIQVVARVLTLGEHKMPFAVIRRESQAIETGHRPLFICMHGGGANPDTTSAHGWNINTREWQTQVQLAIGLYPSDGIYFVPRMADDRLGRWWHSHNHDAFERVIAHSIAHWGVDPDRVYLVGISEGGYGTDILAPFMPDRFAGANAMAAGVDLSNPPKNLRNLAFRTDVGEKDTMFNRVGLAKLFHAELDELKGKDESGYVHHINIQDGKGHGIDYRPGISWIVQHVREAWPSKIAWLSKPLHDRRRTRHYWVEIEGNLGADAVQIDAEADRQTNTLTVVAVRSPIEGDGGNPTHAKRGSLTAPRPLHGLCLRLLLHDDLLDLDRPITVILNDQQIFQGPAHRDAAVQLRTLASYGDPAMVASGELVFNLDE